MGRKDDKSSTNGASTRPPTSDESRLWRDVMRDVTPIERNTADTPEVQPPPETKQPSPSRITAPPRTAQQSAQNATPPPRPRKRPESGIDKRTLERLRRGKMPLEAVLDLHGMRQDEAHRRLVTFVLSCWMSGQRALLIITGKGTRSAEPGGVLRKQVPRWLHDDPLGEKVLTIQTAQPKDGGTGAYYVLLRRQRD